MITVLNSVSQMDKFMEAWGGSITVDLSAHTNELKKAIIKVLIDKFFKCKGGVYIFW